MIEIKVLGTGCSKCKATQKLIEDVLAVKRIAARVEKVEDIPGIMKYGVLGTPGVVVNGKVMHAGGVPSRAQVESWLASVS